MNLHWPDLTLPPINLWSMPMGKNDTPCNGICRLDNTHTYCVGCGRTKQDLYRWMRMTPKEREAATAEAHRRLWDD